MFMKTFFLLLLIAISMASNAMAAPCGGDIPPLDELRRVIRDAGDERPVSITFLTEAGGIKLSRRLLLQYPQKMTIILQYQFRHLVVADDRLAVELEFKGIPERLVIPFDAITALYDPSVRKC
jgi:hypothetical protein